MRSWRCVVRRVVVAGAAFVASAASVVNVAAGQVAAPPPAREGGKVAPLFASNDVLQLTLTTDMRSVLRDRDSTDVKDHAATLAWAEGGAPATLDVQVRTRGHWRRQQRNCEFPPLRVTYPKGTRKGTIFAGQGHLKLVTHCRDRDDYEQYILGEYLAYRAYNLLTPLSFRARLARVTYTDASGRVGPVTRFAMFVEDDADVAKRNGAKLLEQKGAAYEDLDLETAALATAFNYMIGNHDWSVFALHNFVLLRDSLAAPAPVPYDFDFSGLVNTRYAVPPPQVPVKSVTQRYYRGPCLTTEQWTPILARFTAQRGAIYALYTSLPPLDRKQAARARDYLDEFYQTIGDRRAIKRELIDTCKAR
ncbi:MAG: hypothetical protein WKG32_18740 [Gemmatimonadaceae bacterium]